MKEFSEWLVICFTGIFSTLGLINGNKPMGAFLGILFLGFLLVKFLDRNKLPNK